MIDRMEPGTRLSFQELPKSGLTNIWSPVVVRMLSGVQDGASNSLTGSSLSGFGSRTQVLPASAVTRRDRDVAAYTVPAAFEEGVNVSNGLRRNGRASHSREPAVA